jgi:hypothetical protein
MVVGPALASISSTNAPSNVAWDTKTRAPKHAHATRMDSGLAKRHAAPGRSVKNIQLLPTLRVSVRAIATVIDAYTGARRDTKALARSRRGVKTTKSGVERSCSVQSGIVES